MAYLGMFYNLHNYLLTYSIEQSPWEANQFSARQDTPANYGTRSFITAFTTALLLSLSWDSSSQSITPPPTSWRSILILLSHLCLGLSSFLFPSGFSPKPCISLSCPPYALHSAHISFFSEFYRSNNSRLVPCHKVPVSHAHSTPLHFHSRRHNPQIPLLTNKPTANP